MTQSALSSPAAAKAFEVIAAQTAPAAILDQTLTAAVEVFGATGGFFLLGSEVRPGVPAPPRIAHFRGLDVDALRNAAADQSFFYALLAGEEPVVLAADQPAVAQFDKTGVMAALPLRAHGRALGRLVLLLPHRPSAEEVGALSALATHAALALGSAALQESLADRGDQLASVVHSMANPVVVVDDQGRFSMVNGAASLIFNLAGQFEAGQPVGGRLGPELGGLLRRDQDETIELVLGSPEPRLYRVTSRRVLSGRGASLGRVLVLDDLTVEHEADRLKSDFVAVVGHELRTPLTVVRGYAQALATHWRTLDDERREQAVAALDESARRLERLIEGVLFVAAVDDRLPPLELSREDLHAMLAGFASDRVTVNRGAEPFWYVVDRSMLEAVMHQLVENALKYSDGPVTVDTITREDEVEISVTDEGEGIFSGDLPLLFHRFSQVDGTSTRRQGGMGIGLYISRRLVEGMGGRIWGESRLGLGSRFALTLPKRDGDLRPA